MINRPSLKNKSFILKTIFLIALTMFIVSSLAMSYAYSLKPTTTYKDVIKYGELSLTPKIRIYVKPALIYDYKPYIEENEVVLNLVKNIELNVSFKSTIYNNTELGNLKYQKIRYRVYGVINVGEWSKSIDITNITTINGASFNKKIIINLSHIRSIVDRISIETGTKFYTYKYTVLVEVSSFANYNTGKSKEYSIKPKIIFTFSTERNKLSITYSDLTGEYKDEKVHSRQNIVYGIYTVYDFRKITLISSIVLGSITLSMLVMIVRGRSMNGENELDYYMKRYKPLIINVHKLNEYQREKIVVNNMEELFKLARTYNVPIIVDEKQCLYTILNGMVYEYCKQAKNEK